MVFFIAPVFVLIKIQAIRASGAKDWRGSERSRVDRRGLIQTKQALKIMYVCQTNTYRTLASRIVRRCNPGDQSSRRFLIGFDNTAANSVH